MCERESLTGDHISLDPPELLGAAQRENFMLPEVLFPVSD